ncbi:hypothetical protein KCP75_26215 [Salmonella enterica subsp. enterica]|nr:hypothetical protein KCP75_26215 [Salmonella enterica subsp. enterica]
MSEMSHCQCCLQKCWDSGVNKVLIVELRVRWYGRDIGTAPPSPRPVPGDQRGNRLYRGRILTMKQGLH